MKERVRSQLPVQLTERRWRMGCSRSSTLGLRRKGEMSEMDPVRFVAYLTKMGPEASAASRARMLGLNSFLTMKIEEDPFLVSRDGNFDISFRGDNKRRRGILKMECPLL